MTQTDPPAPSDDEAWWAALAGVPVPDRSAGAVASNARTASTTEDAQFARQLGSALRRQSLVEQQAELPQADAAEDARRRAALLERARQAGLLAPRGDARGPSPLRGTQGQDSKAPDQSAAQAPPRAPATLPAPARTSGVAAARLMPGRLLALGLLASGVLVATMWWAGRPAGLSGPPPELLRGSAVPEASFDRQDAALAARQAQALLESAGLAVEASRRPDERGFAWVLEFDAPAAPAPVAAPGPANALAALGLPAWQRGPQRWVFRPAAPVQREGAASKATNPAQ